MKYAILGAGGMGLHFGILLQKAGYQVDFIDTWKPEVEAIRKQHGVYTARSGQDKHFTKVNIYYPEEYHGHPDVVIPFTKQMGLSEMLKRCAHIFNQHQYAVTLMNGMGHIPKIDKYFDHQHVIGGTAMIASILHHPGNVDFVGKPGYGSCNLTNQTEKPDHTTKEIVKEFKEAGLGPNLTTNFMGTLLAKIIVNSVLNTLCTGLQCTMGQFIKSPASKSISVDLINEAFDVCERAGIKLLTTRKQEWESIYKVSAVGAPNHYPSMYQDLANNRPTEVGYINGYLYRLGLKYGYVAHAQKFAINLVHVSEVLHKIKNNN